MRITQPKHLLEAWEETHGKLENPRWIKMFLDNELVPEILKHRPENIAVAVRRNEKLIDILEDLYRQQENSDEFNSKFHPYKNAQKSEGGSKIESREKESGRWGRRFI